ncbi:hypothetical protein [Pseudoxanthomonas broegbernensis]|nr:hypothetical protein [Pseudoxanthomonas broegbernensis]MBB6063541.1 hypothetical protein [Pseudoxanthomonas broegbernensis]
MSKFLLALHVALGASLLLWPAPAFLALFLLDAPGIEGNPMAPAFLAALFGYPVPVLAGGIAFWRLRRARPRRHLAAWTLVACTGPAALFLCWVLGRSA